MMAACGLLQLKCLQLPVSVLASGRALAVAATLLSPSRRRYHRCRRVMLLYPTRRLLLFLVLAADVIVCTGTWNRDSSAVSGCMKHMQACGVFVGMPKALFEVLRRSPGMDLAAPPSSAHPWPSLPA